MEWEAAHTLYLDARSFIKGRPFCRVAITQLGITFTHAGTGAEVSFGDFRCGSVDVAHFTACLFQEAGVDVSPIAFRGVLPLCESVVAERSDDGLTFQVSIVMRIQGR